MSKSKGVNRNVTHAASKITVLDYSPPPINIHKPPNLFIYAG